LESGAEEPSRRPSIFCGGLTFRYEEGRRPVFEDVSFCVERGETVLLMGPSGCGKSTLAYCLAGLYPEYAGTRTGELRVEGEDVASLSPNVRAKLVSILFQNPDNQFCMGRVDHEILFALENIVYPGDMRERARELLRLVGLEWAEAEPIHALSGGTKQKIALAAAMATEAKTLILDEPFANVDPDAGLDWARLLKSLNESGVTLFVVDHRLDPWRSFLSRVMIMDRDGRVRETIYPEELESKKSAFTERGLFFGNGLPEGLARPSPPPAPPENAVVIENLSVTYGGKAVFSSLSLTIRKGTITAIIGRNGSGKSSLLSAIAGLIPFRGGLGVFAKVGLVFQNPRYQFLSLKVRDEIRITLESAGLAGNGGAIGAETDALLAEFDLAPYADASPYVLSQGQQRRLAILSMLAGRRPILLLDEPTYAQDERATFFIMDLLRKRVSLGLTAIIATHDHALAEAFAHRVLCLADGTLSERNNDDPVI
jgi:energy-coupling factor transport system ATP-binding protein